jgi:hypothetical protein
MQTTRVTTPGRPIASQKLCDVRPRLSKVRNYLGRSFDIYRGRLAVAQGQAEHASDTSTVIIRNAMEFPVA